MILTNQIVALYSRHPHTSKYRVLPQTLSLSHFEKLGLQPVMESLACSVLEKNLERLKDSIVNHARFACQLRVAQIITDEDLARALNKDASASKRIDDLMSTIVKNSTEGIFQKFIEILAEGELAELGRQMKGI